MQKIKKNWLYDNEKITRIMIVIALTFAAILIPLKFIIDKDIFIGIREYSDKIYLVILFFLLLEPVFILKSISPQIGSDKVYLNTTNLPFTRKELFYKSLKKIILNLVFFIIVHTLIYIILVSGEIGLIEVLLLTIGKFLILLPFTLTIFFQVFVGIILYLVKKFKSQKAILTMVGMDLVLAGILSLIANILGKEFTDTFYFVPIVIGLYFVPSLLLFLRYWNDIEKIHS